MIKEPTIGTRFMLNHTEYRITSFLDEPNTGLVEIADVGRRWFFRIPTAFLAPLLAAGEAAQCETCGLWFHLDDKRRRFCPPPEGVHESRCAIRIRMRKRRAAERLRVKA